MSHIISGLRNSSEIARLPADAKKNLLKTSFKDIKNWIVNRTFLIDDPEKRYQGTPCVDVYKAKIQSDGSHDKLKLIIVVRGDLQNNEIIRDIGLKQHQ